MQVQTVVLEQEVHVDAAEVVHGVPEVEGAIPAPVSRNAVVSAGTAADGIRIFHSRKENASSSV